MKYINKGCTRLVFLIGKYAIKIPNFTYSHHHFLIGCKSNWYERELYKMSKGLDYRNLMCKSYFCSWFGLIQIQERVKELDRDLTEDEIITYKDICKSDIKKENFGIDSKGNLVCIDYG